MNIMHFGVRLTPKKYQFDFYYSMVELISFLHFTQIVLLLLLLFVINRMDVFI